MQQKYIYGNHFNVAHVNPQEELCVGLINVTVDSEVSNCSLKVDFTLIHPLHMFSYWSWSLTLVQQYAKFHIFIIHRSNHTRITRFSPHQITQPCNSRSQEQPHLHLSGKHDFQIKRKRANNTKWVMCTFNLNFQLKEVWIWCQTFYFRWRKHTFFSCIQIGEKIENLVLDEITLEEKLCANNLTKHKIAIF